MKTAEVENNKLGMTDEKEKEVSIDNVMEASKEQRLESVLLQSIEEAERLDEAKDQKH